MFNAQASQAVMALKIYSRDSLHITHITYQVQGPRTRLEIAR